MLLPPAQSPEAVLKSTMTSEHQASLTSPMRTTGRPGTAFAAYMEAKRNGSEQIPLTSPGIQERPPSGADTSPKLHSSSMRSRTHSRQSQQDPKLSRSQSLQQHQNHQQPLRPLTASWQQGSPEGLHQTLRVAPAVPGTSSQHRQQQQQEVDYLSLTNAARSLAEAASSLANSLSPKARKAHPDYQAFAQAAQDLAENSGLPTSPPLQQVPPRSAPHAHGPEHHSTPSPHPLADSAPHRLSQASPVRGAPRQDPHQALVPWSLRGQDAGSGTPLRPSSRAATPNSTRVHTPKFPPVNPIIAMRASEPPPSYAAAVAGAPGGSRGGLATPQSRPYTANPITHTLDDGMRPGSSMLSRPGSTQGVALGPTGRHYSVSGRSTPGPGDAGSQASQVLSVAGGICEGDAEQAQVQRPESRREKITDIEKDTFEFMFRHPDRVRLTTWPPPASFTESEIMSDDAAQKYNAALENMRQRLYTHGTKPLLNAFKIADDVRSGSLDPDAFKKVLSNMEFGVALDDQMVNQILMDINKTDDGRVDYQGFITALRFNTLPSKPYNKKFKHRVAPNSDMPCGDPLISYPYGTLNDKQVNEQKILNKMNYKHMDLKQAFEMMDSDQDGYITFGEFKNAMKDLNKRHNLKLNDEYISKAFREADWDYNRAIDYDEFLSTFAGTAGLRFVPEFMKPQSLRCSTLTAPWEDQRCHIMADTRRAQEAAALGLDSTRSRTGRFPKTPNKPATPLAGESSRLLRSLRAQ